jgi:hypothetical protein
MWNLITCQMCWIKDALSLSFERYYTLWCKDFLFHYWSRGFLSKSFILIYKKFWLRSLFFERRTVDNYYVFFFDECLILSNLTACFTLLNKFLTEINFNISRMIFYQSFIFYYLIFFYCKQFFVNNLNFCNSLNNIAFKSLLFLVLKFLIKVLEIKFLVVLLLIITSNTIRIIN